MQNTADLPRFKQVQYEFTRHVRNPASNPRPNDVEARRINIYNELLFNNVESFISNTYPILHEICGEEKWLRMVRDYFEKHHATTPLFQEMPREFLKYLENEREAEQDDFPFMLELAHYEWVELALMVSDAEPDYSKIDPEGDLLEGHPVLSPLAWPLSYQFDVQNIGPDHLPDEPAEQPSFIVVYRNRKDEVHFLELNPVTAHMLQVISEGTTQTSREILSDIAEQLNHPNPDVVIQGGLQILHDLKTRDVILGVAKSD